MIVGKNVNFKNSQLNVHMNFGGKEKCGRLIAIEFVYVFKLEIYFYRVIAFIVFLNIMIYPIGSRD